MMNLEKNPKSGHLAFFTGLYKRAKINSFQYHPLRLIYTSKNRSKLVGFKEQKIFCIEKT
jgi:hypothetical protein